MTLANPRGGPGLTFGATKPICKVIYTVAAQCRVGHHQRVRLLIAFPFSAPALPPPGPPGPGVLCTP